MLSFIYLITQGSIIIMGLMFGHPKPTEIRATPTPTATPSSYEHLDYTNSSRG